MLLFRTLSAASPPDSESGPCLLLFVERLWTHQTFLLLAALELMAAMQSRQGKYKEAIDLYLDKGLAVKFTDKREKYWQIANWYRKLSKPAEAMETFAKLLDGGFGEYEQFFSHLVYCVPPSS